MAKQVVLLVDDDESLAALMGEYLTRFDLSLTHCSTPTAGIAAIESQHFAAVILDVMLPEMNGFELCKKIRHMHPQLPIMMLTACGDVTDRVVGLEIGADDYLPKPFEPRELAARLQALIRRAGMVKTSSKELAFDGLRIDLSRRRVWCDGHREVTLTASEFRMLAILVDERPKVITREQLIEQIRGFDADIFDRSIDICISRLRTKLGDTPQKPRFIQTMRSVGYAFIATPKE